VQTNTPKLEERRLKGAESGFYLSLSFNRIRGLNLHRTKKKKKTGKVYTA